MAGAPVIASDLEGTLTSGETWRAVGRYWVEHGEGQRYRRFVRRRLPEVALARVGLLPRQPFRDRWIRDLAQLFRGCSQADVDGIATWVMDGVLWPRRHEGVLAELAAHRAAGARVVLVSGTYQPMLERFAARIGAEAYGSRLEMRDGAATGALQGVNTGGRKVATLRDVLQGAPLVAAYGDSWADAPMLESSDAPVAVGPDRRLAELARERGWRVIEAA
jgi:HAD superfamily phosphoserine phosphatase-like hydrolase